MWQKEISSFSVSRLNLIINMREKCLWIDNPGCISSEPWTIQEPLTQDNSALEELIL